MATFSNAFIQITKSWTEIKDVISSKILSMQFDELNDKYEIFAIDMPITYISIIYKGSVPDGPGFDQSQNDSDKSDFETNYKSYANKPIEHPDFTEFDDSRIIRRFGQLTATSTSEVLLYPRTYAEPASQAQRSIVSTSATDSDTLGTGARQVRITYLDSNYVLKTEDVLTNGLVGVNTVATDIRFIESIEVIKGTVAVGAVRLMTGLAGAGTEIAAIAAATGQTFFCHHYIPAGKRAWVIGWGLVSDDETNTKLLGQDKFGTNLVDRVLDLENLRNGNLTPPNRLIMTRDLKGVTVPEKTYVRVTVVPSQATSTTMRGYIYFFEDVK